MSYLIKTNTLSFDLYGDIAIENNDIVVNVDLKAKIQVIADYLKSSFNDYAFYPKYGSNYDQDIGKGITNSLVSSLETRIQKGIDSLDILPTGVVEVVARQKDNNSIEARVILYDSDDTTIYLTLNKEEGTLIDY